MGTAKLTAYSRSASAIARVGSTINSLAFVLTDVWALAPRTTIPSLRRSTIRT